MLLIVLKLRLGFVVQPVGPITFELIQALLMAVKNMSLAVAKYFDMEHLKPQ